MNTFVIASLSTAGAAVLMLSVALIGHVTYCCQRRNETVSGDIVDAYADDGIVL